MEPVILRKDHIYRSIFMNTHDLKDWIPSEHTKMNATEKEKIFGNPEGNLKGQ